jgi:hypothetical protein
MLGTTLLAGLRARGLQLRVDGETLLVSPRRLLTDADRAALRMNKPALRLLLEAEGAAPLDAEADPGVAVAHDVFPAETGSSSASEQPDLAVLRAELAVRAAARETAIAWRKAAMRAQLEQVRSGERIPLLKARPEFHVSVPNSECGDRSDGPLDPEGGCACPSCGEPSRFPGGRCDPCFGAALRVVPMDVLVRRKGRR